MPSNAASDPVSLRMRSSRSLTLHILQHQLGRICPHEHEHVLDFVASASWPCEVQMTVPVVMWFQSRVPDLSCDCTDGPAHTRDELSCGYLLGADLWPGSGDRDRH